MNKQNRDPAIAAAQNSDLGVDVTALTPEETKVNPPYVGDAPTRRKQFSMFDTRTDVAFKDLSFFEKYYPYWRLDEGNRISGLLDRGYVFVDPSEIEHGDIETTPRENGGGTRVRRYAGTGAKGEPTYFYLMKQPIDFHREDEAAREAYHSRIDGAIGTGTFNQQRGDGRYSAANQPQGSPSNIPPISRSTKLYT